MISGLAGLMPNISGGAGGLSADSTAASRVGDVNHRFNIAPGINVNVPEFVKNDIFKQVIVGVVVTSIVYLIVNKK